MRRVLAALLLPVLVAACSYDPPVVADRESDQYRSDLGKCRAEGTREASKVTGATLWSFMKSPVTYPPLRHDAIRACMLKRGYALRAGETG